MRGRIGFSLAALALAACPALAQENVRNPRHMVFPEIPGGGVILPVDLHTHSVFSDGRVWPTVRVREAERDGLAAIAVTEHVEIQPNVVDIPNPDRNRSFAIASAAVKGQLLVINGAEITRSFPIGHVNAVFLTDANALRQNDAEDAIRQANDQGGFVFWNHPWSTEPPPGVVRLHPVQKRLIAAGLLHGIEVANGDAYSESALAIALEQGLAILGNSDVHGLIDWDYNLAAGDHRTVTLVLSQDRTGPAINEALRAGKTVVWYKNRLIGRPQNVEVVAQSSLTMEIGSVAHAGRARNVTIRNASPVRYILRAGAPYTFWNSTDLVTVPPYGKTELQLTGDVETARAHLSFEILNSVTAPRKMLTLDLKPAS